MGEVPVHLFISSFKINFFIKTLTIFFILFIIYSAFIIHYKPQITRTQHQWQDNIIAAQEYIYNYYKKPIVIIGSSLSARLHWDLQPDFLHNLSFGGGSGLDGLEIIISSNATPEYIFIESNMIERPENSTLHKQVFFPVLWELKKVFIPLQEKYQPLNLILSFIKNKSGYSRNEMLNWKVNPEVFNKMLKLNKVAFSDCNEKDVIESIKSLKQKIDIIEARGTTICFFEMPMHESLAESKKNKLIRREIKKNFADYILIQKPDHSIYQTTDGIHLTYKDSFNFSNTFLSSVNNIITK